MPRPLRIHVPGGFYHVTLRGNHRRALFVDAGDQRLLGKIVARALEESECLLHAYCWMTNHLHLLIQVNQEPLANPMRNIARQFARAMQQKLETTGHFFERRYHAALVDVQSYFLELIRYIHLNPVSAGIVEHPHQYRWSSHHAYVGARDEPWVTTDFALRMFAPDRRRALAAYQQFLNRDDAASWDPERILNTTEFEPANSVQSVPRIAFETPCRQTLGGLIAEACHRFNVTPERLESPRRDPYVSRVRAWIAHQAITRHVCGISAVARALRRDESTLREAMRAHPNEL
jgi:REP element-mobilizing transposase RayT